MAFVMTIDAKGFIEVADGMRRLTQELPKASERDLWNISQMLGKELRKSIMMAKIKDNTGILRSGTFPQKNKKYEYLFLMPRHARWLDSMRPHDVYIGDKPDLLRWYQNQPWAIPGFRGLIFVKPRPFIQRAFDRTAARITNELERGAVVRTAKSIIASKGGKMV